MKKNRINNWKWWVTVPLALPAAAVAIICFPIFTTGLLLVGVAEGLTAIVARMLCELHLFAHGWVKHVKYNGVLGVYNIEGKDND